MTATCSRLVDEFAARAAACSSDETLAALVADALRDLGFDYFALLHHASLRPGSGALIRLDNYPPSWVAEIGRARLAGDDPVHLACGRSLAGFRWDDIAALVPLTARHREVFARSGRHGIGPGFTVPANVPGEPSGSCSFAVRRGLALPEARLHEAELVGARAFGAARRLHGYPAGGGRPHLSRREVECLRLIAAGKTDWEIGRVLGIGEATARHYAKRARAAYDVVSRCQLVVHGLRDGWIGFEDASPPCGGMG